MTYRSRLRLCVWMPIDPPQQQRIKADDHDLHYWAAARIFDTLNEEIPHPETHWNTASNTLWIMVRRSLRRVTR